MRRRRTSPVIVIAVLAAMLLSGCSGPAGTPGTTSDSPVGASIAVAEVNAFTSFNSESASGASDINAKVGYATRSAFNYIDNELKVVRNDKYGSYEKVSDDPLTVRYTVNEGVKWSDGEPVTAADMVLSWAVSSGRFNDAGPDGKTGNTYFQAAPSGLSLTDVPEIGDDNRSITLRYSQPFADWELAFEIGQPAHVVAEKSGLADKEELVDLLLTTPKGDAAKPAPENPELRSVADFWNTGFDSKTLPADPALYLSNGPFIVSAIDPGQSVTLIRNEDYDWGPKPRVSEITVRYIGTAPDQVQALQNGEVDVIAPQAAADTLEQLEKLPAVTVVRGDTLTYDHLDLNFTGPFADRDVREAFMKTVPRRQIIDTIVKKLNPEAEPLNSHLFVPEQAAYKETVASNGSAEFAEVDIEGARRLLDGATPTVRIMYNKDNSNRLDTFTLISESAAKAGFKVVDGGLDDSAWSEALGNGTYDAAIFGWGSPGIGVSGVPQIFQTGSPFNFNGFSDPEADKLMNELIVEPDQAERDEMRIAIDRLIWESRYGLPLFQEVGIMAHRNAVTGVKFTPNQLGLWWNFWEWSVND